MSHPPWGIEGRAGYLTGRVPTRLNQVAVLLLRPQHGHGIDRRRP